VNLAACPSLTLVPETRTWYRATELRFVSVPINTAHTKAVTSRFSAGLSASTPFEILYLGDNPLVAQFELEFLWGSPLSPGGVLPSPRSCVIVNVTVQLQWVVDLTMVSEQTLLETTVQELTGDWRGYHLRASPLAAVRDPVGTAPTQDLGEALFATPGIEGFRAVSAKLPYHTNLAVFPEKMYVGSRLEFRYDLLGVLQVIDGHVPVPAPAPPRRRRRP
jgi:hypothetical protein